MCTSRYAPRVLHHGPPGPCVALNRYAFECDSATRCFRCQAFGFTVLLVFELDRTLPVCAQRVYCNTIGDRQAGMHSHRHESQARNELMLAAKQMRRIQIGAERHCRQSVLCCSNPVHNSTYGKWSGIFTAPKYLSRSLAGTTSLTATLRVTVMM